MFLSSVPFGIVELSVDDLTSISNRDSEFQLGISAEISYFSLFRGKVMGMQSGWLALRASMIVLSIGHVLF